MQAASVASPSVRSAIVSAMAQWLNDTVTDTPFTDWYMTEGNGEYGGGQFTARPVVGSHFAFLAIGEACHGKAEPEGLWH